MDRLKLCVGLLLVPGAAALPAPAVAQSLVPPGNSAAIQYTEAIPTTGGEQETEGDKKPRHVRPAKVIGSENAHRLAAKGAVGQAAATVAAETSPAPVVEEPVGGEEQAAAKKDQAQQPGGTDHGERHGAAAGPVAGGGNPPSGGQSASGGSGTPEPSGSSGVAEVASQALGSPSSGGLGLLLPLIVIGTVVWSVAFLLRRRRHPVA